MTSRQPATGRAAFSMVELVITIALIGILAAIAIPSFSNVRDASEKAIAEDHMESLNRAVTSFSQACWKLPTAPDASSSTDEVAVLRSLQYQFPTADLIPGSPFYDQRYDPAVSSDSKHFRIRWNGKSFELLEPGTTGTGLRFNSGTELKKDPVTFPPGYKPEGAP